VPNPKTGNLEIPKEILIETRGSNLRAVMNMPGTDHTRIMSNTPADVEEHLGIEAAITILIHEGQRVFAQNDAYVNYHNLHTLASAMAKTGTLVSLSRSGVHQDRRQGFLKRCSFEKIVRVLMDAAHVGD